MFPSGPWEGFWEQEECGRQPMEQFELHFSPDGQVHGSGSDIVGLFHFTGQVELSTGRIQLIKQYLGAHQVFYAGQSDGEGCILGMWTIREPWFYDTGPFALKPVLRRPTGDEPIEDITERWTRLGS